MVVKAIAVLKGEKDCCNSIKNKVNTSNQITNQSTNQTNKSIETFINEMCEIKQIEGTIIFEQEVTGGATTITINLKGVPVGPHGLHIHEFGDLSNGCTSAGAHYNPTKQTHGGQTDTVRHVGDLGNVIADLEGNVNVVIVDEQISLIGDHSVIGRSIVLHEDEDDLGKGGHELSSTTGNSGARIACGVIGIAKN